MQPAQRIVTQLPLRELWNDEGLLHSEREREVSAEEIRAMFRNGPLQFVVANVGEKLIWIALENCHEFWKKRALSHVCDPDSTIRLEHFPNGLAYLASVWSSDAAPIVVLEAYH